MSEDFFEGRGGGSKHDNVFLVEKDMKSLHENYSWKI